MIGGSAAPSASDRWSVRVNLRTAVKEDGVTEGLVFIHGHEGPWENKEKIMRYGVYTDSDVRRDAAYPAGYAPEELMPLEIRRTERLRGREIGYRLAESLIVHGAPIEAAAQLMAVPHQVRTEDRRWAVRMEEARLCGNLTMCAMPVRGCRDHGDTLAWHKGGWKCQVPKCRGGFWIGEQRRHCDRRCVAVIDYPSGHQRRVCAGHLASERAFWATQPAGATIRVAHGPAPVDVDSAAGGGLVGARGDDR